jgi:hypothetical protein
MTARHRYASLTATRRLRRIERDYEYDASQTGEAIRLLLLSL